MERYIYHTIATHGECILHACRDSSGINFAFQINDKNVHLVFCRDMDSETGEKTYSYLTLSQFVLDLTGEELQQVKKAFDEFNYLVMQFYYITVDKDHNNPYRKTDLQMLLSIPCLLPHERQAIQNIYNEFTYIYIIYDKDTKFTKIGRSNNPQNRLKELKRQATLQPTPNDYILLFCWLDRLFVEDQLHQRFSHKRIRGEWFNLDIEDIKVIHQLCATYSEDFKEFASNLNEV